MTRMTHILARTKCRVPEWDTGDVPASWIGGFSHKGKSPATGGKFTPGVFRVLPYSAISVDYGETMGDSQVTTTYKKDGYDCTRTYNGRLPLHVPFDWSYVTYPGNVDTLRKIALQKAFAKVGRKELGGGENLGEIKETLSMLKSPLKGLRRAILGKGGENLRMMKTIRDAKRSGIKRLKELPGNTADQWLEFRYGVMPLIYTIQDAADYLEKQRSRLDPKRIKTVRSKEKDSTSFRHDYGIEPSYEFVMTRTIAGMKKLRVTAIVYWRQSKPLTTQVELGLGLRHLPETAWELTGMSFVMDWFLSVGDWIESWRFNPEFEILGATTSVKMDVEGSTHCTLSNGPYGWMLESQSMLQAPLTASVFDRYVEEGHPPLLPQFAGLANMNFSRYADSLALLYKPVVRAMR